MKTTYRDRFLAILLCVYMGFLPGCGNDGNPSDAANTPPGIPPPETMQMDSADLAFFNQNNQATDEAMQITPKLNFLAAALVVTAFNLAVLVGISVPVIAAAAALSVEPTLESDGKFHWKFSYPATNPTLELELTAQIKPEVVAWEMLVTRQLPTPLDGFLWYEGESEIAGGSGYWQFYDDQSPNEKQEIARIDWEYVADNDRTLKFTNNDEDSKDFGNTLTYTLDNDDASLLFVDSAPQDTTHISWDRQSGEGFIIAPNFRNGEKSCWDSNQRDVDCQN